MFNGNSPQYLYYDYDTDHFEVASFATARKHKHIFTVDEVKQIRADYPSVSGEFLLDEVKRDKEG